MNIKDRNPEKKEWTIEIRPKKRLLDIDLKGLWLYRDLFYMYVKRDIITVYKQTILGPLWFLIQPILTTIMLFNSLLYFYYTMWRIATQLVYTFLRVFDNKKDTQLYD